jgi:hypothetical protein
MQPSKSSIHDLIHLDDALERHLSTILDQESCSILDDSKRSNGNDDTSISPDNDPSFSTVSDAVSRIKSSDGYKNLVNEIQQANFPPPPSLSNQRKTQVKSFSLFDGIQSSTGGGGVGQAGNLSFVTSLPSISAAHNFVNVRDILESNLNLAEMLVKAMDASVLDLILDFNTTQHEIELLAKHLYSGLQLEVGSELQNVARKQNSSVSNETYLELHQKWFHDCMMEDEALSFAFLLVRNVVLVSAANGVTTSCESRLKLVHLVKEMLTLIMQKWSDVGMFQREWFQLVYLWIRCSFHSSMHNVSKCPNIAVAVVNSVHGTWAQVDPKGSLFDLCLKCINSTWMIQLLFIKTRLVEYMRSVLLYGFERHPMQHDSQQERDDDTLDFGSLLCHTISMFRTVIVHSSPMIMFHVKDMDVYADASMEVPLTLEIINDELCWIQKHEENIKKWIVELSTQKKLSHEDIQYIVAPFLVLMEIGLTETRGDNDLVAHDDLYSSQKAANHIVTGDEYLVKRSAECLIHIMQSCGNSSSLQAIFNQVAKDFFGMAPKILSCCSGRTEPLPLAVVEYVHVITQVSKCEWVWQNDDWCKQATTVVRDVLSPLVRELSVLENTRISFKSWNQLLGVLEPILIHPKHHHPQQNQYNELMGSVSTLLSDYAKVVKNCTTCCSSNGHENDPT